MTRHIHSDGGRAAKARMIEELSAVVSRATALYFLDFTKVSANDIAQFRRRLREQHIRMRVVKNRLALRALTASGIPEEEIKGLLRGPTSVVFASADPLAPVRLFRETAAKLKELRFKGAYFERRVYGPDQLDFLARLPTKNELRAQAVGVLSGPVDELVFTLDGVLRELVWLCEKKAEKGAQ